MDHLKGSPFSMLAYPTCCRVYNIFLHHLYIYIIHVYILYIYCLYCTKCYRFYARKKNPQDWIILESLQLHVVAKSRPSARRISRPLAASGSAPSTTPRRRSGTNASWKPGKRGAAWNAQAMVKLESHTTWVSPIDLGLQVETHISFYVDLEGLSFWGLGGFWKFPMCLSNVSAFSCQPRSQKFHYPGSVSFN